MNNQVKTNAELIEKISCLNQRIRELKQTESDRKQAEEALQESELKYRTLVELTHDFVFMVDRKGLFTYVNPNFEKTTGYSFSDLKGHPLRAAIDPSPS